MKKFITAVCMAAAILCIIIFFNRRSSENLVASGQALEEVNSNEGQDEESIELGADNNIGIDEEKAEVEEQDEGNEEDESFECITIASEDVRIPILMYHSICSDDPDNSLMIPTEMFAEQMEWLRENDFTAMSMDDVIEAMNTGKVPKRPVLITFDDGYADNYINAFPELKNNNLKGTFFIISDTITEEGGYYMSTSMLKEMKEAGMEIENHTANHLELNNLSREDAIDSIKRGQEFLRSVIGSNGNYLCYPVGRYSDETIEIQKELGIKAALTTQGGISSIADGKYELKRIRISPMNIENFAEIFSEYMY